MPDQPPARHLLDYYGGAIDKGAVWTSLFRMERSEQKGKIHYDMKTTLCGPPVVHYNYL